MEERTNATCVTVSPLKESRCVSVCVFFCVDVRLLVCAKREGFFWEGKWNKARRQSDGQKSMNRRGRKGAKKTYERWGEVLMIKSFRKILSPPLLLCSATARHRCLNESHERKSKALSTPWRHHTQDGMHYKNLPPLFLLFSPVPIPPHPKYILIQLSSLPGRITGMLGKCTARSGRDGWL